MKAIMISRKKIERKKTDDNKKTKRHELDSELISQQTGIKNIISPIHCSQFDLAAAFAEAIVGRYGPNPSGLGPRTVHVGCIENLYTAAEWADTDGSADSYSLVEHGARLEVVEKISISASVQDWDYLTTVDGKAGERDDEGQASSRMR